MKVLLFIVVLLTLSCNVKYLQVGAGNGSQVRAITTSEKQLLDSLEYDYTKLSELLEQTPSPITRLTRTYGQYNYATDEVEYNEKTYEGIMFYCTNTTAHTITEKFRDDLRSQGYLIYQSQRNHTFKPDEVSMIKSEDQFDIVRLEDVQAPNYDLDNFAILAKLKEWNTKHPFQITGASHDWISANFTDKLPKDLSAFALEMYEFCPDIVIQGTDTVEALEAETKKTNQLYLWWD